MCDRENKWARLTLGGDDAGLYAVIVSGEFNPSVRQFRADTKQGRQAISKLDQGFPYAPQARRDFCGVGTAAGQVAPISKLFGAEQVSPFVFAAGYDRLHIAAYGAVSRDGHAETPAVGGRDELLARVCAIGVCLGFAVGPVRHSERLEHGYGFQRVRPERNLNVRIGNDFTETPLQVRADQAGCMNGFHDIRFNTPQRKPAPLLENVPRRIKQVQIVHKCAAAGGALDGLSDNFGSLKTRKRANLIHARWNHGTVRDAGLQRVDGRVAKAGIAQHKTRWIISSEPARRILTRASQMHPARGGT